jgi:proteasome lid subunit RPN8/RPN11
MKKIRVSLSGNGKVTIKLKKERPQEEIRKELASSTGGFLLSSSLINHIEIRVESVFRPGQQDVEIVYALTGSRPDYPEMLHKFSSKEVVAHATPERISAVTEKMAEHILKERPDAPKIIVAVHTHPDAAAELSQQDKSSIVSIARRLRELIPTTNVIFAVHAVSSESPRPRTMPMKIAGNRIKWSSITRTHELAFFNENSEPVEVTI